MTESSGATDSVVDTASTITSGTRLSKFKYWSKFEDRSIGPPWYSCEI